VEKHVPAGEKRILSIKKASGLGGGKNVRMVL